MRKSFLDGQLVFAQQWALLLQPEQAERL